MLSKITFALKGGSALDTAANYATIVSWLLLPFTLMYPVLWGIIYLCGCVGLANEGGNSINLLFAARKLPTINEVSTRKLLVRISASAMAFVIYFLPAILSVVVIKALPVAIAIPMIFVASVWFRTISLYKY